MLSSSILFVLAAIAKATRFFQDQVPFRVDPKIIVNPNLKVPGHNVFKYCHDPSFNSLKIEYLHFKPNPPVVGENFTVTGSGNLTERIHNGSTVHLLVKWGYFTFLNKDYDLCDFTGSLNLTCPLEPGVYNLTKEFSIPETIPRGNYHLAGAMLGNEGRDISCMEADITYA